MASQGISVYENTLTPATPAAGHRLFYPMADGWHDLDDAGNDRLFLAGQDANGVMSINKPGQDPGLFLVSVANNSAVLGGGATWNGAAWVAVVATATTTNLNATGIIQWTVDTGLTPDATFTPTTRMALSSSALSAYVATSIIVENAETNTTPAYLIVSHRSTGTPAASFGSGFYMQAESTTTLDRNQFSVKAYWAVATDASRTTRVDISAYDTAERICIQLGASGTAAMIGFFGTAAVARPTGVAVSAAGIHAALVTLGLITA